MSLYYLPVLSYTLSDFRSGISVRRRDKHGAMRSIAWGMLLLAWQINLFLTDPVVWKDIIIFTFWGLGQLSFFLFKFYYFMWVGIFYLHICLCTTCMQYLGRPAGAIGFPETGLAHDFELPLGAENQTRVLWKTSFWAFALAPQFGLHFFIYLLYVCMSVVVCMPQCSSGGQRIITGSQFSSVILWVQELNLGPQACAQVPLCNVPSLWPLLWLEKRVYSR